MASRNHYLVCVTEVSVGKGESKSNRDNPMIFYYFFEVVALFFALNSSYFAFTIDLFFLLGSEALLFTDSFEVVLPSKFNCVSNYTLSGAYFSAKTFFTCHAYMWQGNMYFSWTYTSISIIMYTKSRLDLNVWGSLHLVDKRMTKRDDCNDSQL